MKVYTKYRDLVRKVANELKAKWKRGKGTFVAVFSMLAHANECLVTSEHDYLVVMSILSANLLSHFEKMVSDITPA